MAKIIDGTLIARNLRTRVAHDAEEFLKETGRQPGLATILIGDDLASRTYVGMKHRACRDVGFHSVSITLPTEVSQQQAIAEVSKLATDPAIDGILIQLPLPKHLNADIILGQIPQDKDVDGFHPTNAGLVSQRSQTPHFVPCTPQGCLYLLKATGVEMKGAHAVVLGRSNLVGLPMALLLLEHHATVSVLHSHTKDWSQHINQADIVVAAIGQPEIVKGFMLKPGSTVIDVGINKKDDPTTLKGYRLVGDVDFASASQVAEWITPVPGGVGPMTIAVLLENTLKAARIHAS